MFVKKEHAPAIWVYEDCFDPKNFISLIENEAKREWAYLSWSSSTTGDQEGGVQSDHRTSLGMYVEALLEEKIDESLKEASETLHSIFSEIDKCIWDYRRCFELPLKAHNGLQLLKYSHGGEYHRHWDHSPDNSRVLSMVASISSECDGGELEFPYLDTKLKLETGSVVLFPSNFPYMHIAHPVTNGIKYSLVTWFI